MNIKSAFAIIIIFIIIFNVNGVAVQGGLITSITNLKADGSVEESKWYDRSYSADGKTKSIKYQDEIHTMDGHLNLSDMFSSDSNVSDNSSDNTSGITASKDIEFNYDNNSNGFIVKIERVDLSIFDCNGNSFFDVAAGDSITTSSIKTSTNVDVDAGDKPSISYQIKSEGERSNFLTANSSLKTGIEITTGGSGSESEHYSEHYAVSGHFKLSKSIKFAK